MHPTTTNDDPRLQRLLDAALFGWPSWRQAPGRGAPSPRERPVSVVAGALSACVDDRPHGTFTVHRPLGIVTDAAGDVHPLEGHAGAELVDCGLCASMTHGQRPTS